jgi:hypothetical protein
MVYWDTMRFILLGKIFVRVQLQIQLQIQLQFRPMMLPQESVMIEAYLLF